jgi:hypothetical protein
MKAAVTDQGVVIPRELLDGWTEVVIERKGDRVEVTAVGAVDAVLGLGRNPVKCGVTDGSTNHDDYVNRP